MPKPKPITKEQILAAMGKTKSNMAAARYLNCSYGHYKKWAKLYESDTHDNLFEQHKNQSGIGIPKFLRVGGKEPALIDIIEGRANASSFTPDKIKYRLITEGYLEEKCAICGFEERRVLDYKMPLLLNFKDDNKKNYKLDNIELLCYNHYFLNVGDIFTNKQIEGIDLYLILSGVNDDAFALQRLKELGLGEDDKEELNIISKL